MDILSSVCGQGISFTIDGFRCVYILIAVFMWLMTALFSPEYFKHYENKKRYYIFFWITFAALVGVFLSKDLFTTFIFFEIMSFTSYVWVAQDERAESLRAAATYLTVAVVGGLVMLMGLFLLYSGTGNTYITSSLIFVGFAAKAGVFPLHIWLPKAHPVAPAPASALLSGILTKSGIFGIIILSYQMMLGDIYWGRAMLILGVITMVLGAILALFSIDLKRTLACSSMSQIGFIMVGIGCGTMLGEEGALAMRGTMLHMVNHSLIKLALFMAAGVVYFNLHKLDLNDIRGFGRNKTFLKAVFLSGALGISGIPLFNGYISKTLLHEGILEASPYLGNWAHAVEYIFLFSGGCTLAYMLKLFIAIFVENNEDVALQAKYDEMKSSYIGRLSCVSLGFSGIILPLLGSFPHVFMDRIADMGSSFLNAEHLEHQVHYFSLENLKGGLISIIIGVLIYFFIIRKLMIRNNKYVDLWPSKLDLENAVYRPVLLVILPSIGYFFAKLCDGLLDAVVVVLRKTIYTDKPIPREYAEGNSLTHFVGSLLDEIHYALAGSDRAPEKSYEHRIVLSHIRNAENYTIITRSLSFGLALACVGLIATLIYIIYSYMS